MRNVLALTLVLAACSSSGEGLATIPPDALPPTVLVRGREVTTDARPEQPLDARAAFADSMSADMLAPVVDPDASPVAPDSLPVALDTLPPDTGPYVPPVTWTPGPEVTDPALLTCPPTKGNSLGIGKACTPGQEGQCMAGTSCMCGSKDNLHSLLPKDMPCMCLWHSTAGATSTTATCDPCGEGAGCCLIRGPKFVDRTCLPNSCFFDCRGS